MNRPPQRRRTNPRDVIARIAAPLALLAAFIAVIAVVSSSGGGGDRKASVGKLPHANGSAAKSSRPHRTHRRKTYRVKVGDNLSTIAENSGTPIARLTQLNPDLDPQALSPGQCVALSSPGDCR
jgi:LysM repeat protein